MRLLLLFTRAWAFVCIFFIAGSNLFPFSTKWNSTPAKTSETDISYSIEPFYDVNIFRFIVVLEFKGDKSGETKLLIPNEYGGQNNIKGIKYLKVLSENSSLHDTDKPEYKIVKHAPNAQVKVYYQVEELRSGDIELGNHYMVVLKRQYFHFLGETFFVIPHLNWGNEYRFKLVWNHMPSNWNLANSFGANEKIQQFTLALWKFRYSVFSGGDFRIIKKNIGENPVYFAIRGKWNFSDNEFSEMSKDILKGERDFWNDHDFPYFLITILPIDGSGDLGGTGRTNSFALFISDDRALDYKLKKLIAHETFHTWLGEKINFSEPEQLLYWFKEGFCDYYARLILLRTNLISLEEYISEYNKVLKMYYTSPARYEKNERLINEFWSDGELNRLPYQRGDIIAHNLNTIILKNSIGRKSLDDLMREILQRCKNEALLVSTGSLNAMIRYYAGDAALAEIMRTLNSNNHLKSNPEALGPCVTMQVDSYKRFWLIGEQYEVPVYQFKNEKLANEKSCIDWYFPNR